MEFCNTQKSIFCNDIIIPKVALFDLHVPKSITLDDVPKVRVIPEFIPDSIPDSRV